MTKLGYWGNRNMRKNLIKNGIILGIIVLFIGAGVLPATGTIKIIEKNEKAMYMISNKIITVDDEGDGDYTSIQQAINKANFGDSIEVYSGTYVENIVVNKMINLIGKDYELGGGSDTGKPIIDGGEVGTVIQTTSDGITITGFKIQNSGNYDCGLHLASHYNTIEDNYIIGNYYGMKLFPSTGNQIRKNYIANNTGDGLWLSHSHENTIGNNTIIGNGMDGISANMSSLSNHIEYNKIAQNKGNGLEISETSFGSIIKMNNITMNTVGLKTTGGSDTNLVHKNNFIKNIEMNAYDTSRNSYDISGMGNYWDDYTGVDEDENGIGDTPYNVPGEGENKDNYPLMEPLSIGDAPYTENLDGPERGVRYKSYTYSVKVIDPQNEKVYCMFLWDDGSDSGWLGPKKSGSTFSASHSWTESSGDYSYEVSAKGKDIENHEGGLHYPPIYLTITKGKNAINPFIIKFLYYHLSYVSILQYLLDV